MVNRCSLCKDSEESANHILIHCDRIKTTLDIVVNNCWFGLGVLGFSEKSYPIMEIQGTRDEEKSSLAAGSDLLILVYSGRAQPKDLRKRRIVEPKAKGSLFQIPCGVVQTVAAFGDLLSFEFFRVSILWLVLLFPRFLLSFLVFGLFIYLFLCILPVYVGCTPFFWRFLIQAFVYKKKIVFCILVLLALLTFEV